MSGGLIPVDGGGAPARCRHCDALAVGPCARCHAPVCGDCCVLTTSSAKVWAICLGCDARGGRSLGRGWWMVLGWIALPMVVLAGIVALLALRAAR